MSSQKNQSGETSVIVLPYAWEQYKCLTDNSDASLFDIVDALGIVSPFAFDSIFVDCNTDKFKIGSLLRPIVKSVWSTLRKQYKIKLNKEGCLTDAQFDLFQNFYRTASKYCKKSGKTKLYSYRDSIIVCSDHVLKHDGKPIKEIVIYGSTQGYTDFSRIAFAAAITKLCSYLLNNSQSFNAQSKNGLFRINSLTLLVTSNLPDFVTSNWIAESDLIPICLFLIAYSIQFGFSTTMLQLNN
ncbi:MAG: hypothetical protein LBP59_10790 [Planctomycetaceae bacterium]|jgi:hypothetical protein|nr:hypothetical protein [Planctomycetaceae bacterium]